MFGIPYAVLAIFMLLMALLNIATLINDWNNGRPVAVAVAVVLAILSLTCATWWAVRAIEDNADPEPAGVVVTVTPTITATAPADVVVTVTPTAGMPS